MTERAAVISGIGQSDVGRRLYRHPLDLTVDGALDAIEDAGLTRDDIDGLATYPGNMDTPPGFSGVGVVELQDALRLNLDWYNGGLENPGQLGSVITACAAVASGYANHILCFRTVWEASAQNASEYSRRIRRAGPFQVIQHSRVRQFFSREWFRSKCQFCRCVFRRRRRLKNCDAYDNLSKFPCGGVVQRNFDYVIMNNRRSRHPRQFVLG